MSLNLRNNNWRSVRTVVVGAAVTAGQMVQLGNGLVGAYMEDGAVGATVAVCYAAEKVRLPKAAAVNFAIGDLVYYDPLAFNLTSVAAGNILCGRATEAAVNADTDMEIDFHGDAIA